MKIVNIEILAIRVVKSELVAMKQIVWGSSRCWKETVVMFLSQNWSHFSVTRRSSQNFITKDVKNKSIISEPKVLFRCRLLSLITNNNN